MAWTAGAGRVNRLWTIGATGAECPFDNGLIFSFAGGAFATLGKRGAIFQEFLGNGNIVLSFCGFVVLLCFGFFEHCRDFLQICATTAVLMVDAVQCRQRGVGSKAVCQDDEQDQRVSAHVLFICADH